MHKNTKQTSKRVASKASKVMRDGRYSKTAKFVGGSPLAQTKKVESNHTKKSTR